MSVTSLHQMDGTSSATATGDVELTQLPVAVLMQRRLAPTGDFTSEAPSCGPRSPLSTKTCGRARGLRGRRGAGKISLPSNFLTLAPGQHP